jgi:hypothetical protein
MAPLLAGKLYIDVSSKEKFQENIECLVRAVRESL